MMDGFGMGFGGAFMWLFLIAVILGIVLMVICGIRSHGGRRERTPRTVLDERYARGDIDEDDYKRRRATLRD